MNFLLCLFPVTAYLVLPNPAIPFKDVSYKDASYYPELSGLSFGRSSVAVGLYISGDILAPHSIFHPTNADYCTDFRVGVGNFKYDFSREQLASWITNHVQPNKKPE